MTTPTFTFAWHPRRPNLLNIFDDHMDGEPVLSLMIHSDEAMSIDYSQPANIPLLLTPDAVLQAARWRRRNPPPPYAYWNEEDVDADHSRIKLTHYVALPDGTLHIAPYSPYAPPNDSWIKLWISLGTPSRADIPQRPHPEATYSGHVSMEELREMSALEYINGRPHP